MSHPLIHNRGRGPEFTGTRITVYDLIPYLEDGTSSDDRVCEILSITPEQLAAGKAYIAEHLAEVMAAHDRIEERIRRGIQDQNRPEFRARFGDTGGRVEYYATWLREREREAANGGPPLPASGPER